MYEDYWTWTLRIKKPKALFQQIRKNLRFIIPAISLLWMAWIASDQIVGFLIGMIASASAIALYYLYK